MTFTSTVTKAWTAIRKTVQTAASPKTTLAHCIANALSSAFVIDPQSGVESRLLSDTRIALRDVKVRPRLLFDFDGYYAVVLTGHVDEVVFSWKWGGGGQGGSGANAFVSETALTVRGGRVRVRIVRLLHKDGEEGEGEDEQDSALLREAMALQRVEEEEAKDSNDGDDCSADGATTVEEESVPMAAPAAGPAPSPSPPSPSPSPPPSGEGRLERYVRQIVEGLTLNISDVELVVDLSPPPPRTMATRPQSTSAALDQQTCCSSEEPSDADVVIVGEEKEKEAASPPHQLSSTPSPLSPRALRFRLGSVQLESMGRQREGRPVQPKPQPSSDAKTSRPPPPLKQMITMDSIRLDVLAAAVAAPTPSYSLVGGASGDDDVVVRPILEPFHYRADVTRVSGKRFVGGISTGLVVVGTVDGDKHGGNVEDDGDKDDDGAGTATESSTPTTTTTMAPSSGGALDEDAPSASSSSPDRGNTGDNEERRSSDGSGVNTPSTLLLPGDEPGDDSLTKANVAQEKGRQGKRRLGDVIFHLDSVQLRAMKRLSNLISTSTKEAVKENADGGVTSTATATATASVEEEAAKVRRTVTITTTSEGTEVDEKDVSCGEGNERVRGEPPSSSAPSSSLSSAASAFSSIFLLPLRSITFVLGSANCDDRPPVQIDVPDCKFTYRTDGKISNLQGWGGIAMDGRSVLSMAEHRKYVVDFATSKVRFDRTKTFNEMNKPANDDTTRSAANNGSDDDDSIAASVRVTLDQTRRLLSAIDRMATSVASHRYTGATRDGNDEGLLDDAGKEEDKGRSNEEDRHDDEGSSSTTSSSTTSSSACWSFEARGDIPIRLVGSTDDEWVDARIYRPLVSSCGGAERQGGSLSGSGAEAGAGARGLPFQLQFDSITLGPSSFGSFSVHVPPTAILPSQEVVRIDGTVDIRADSIGQFDRLRCFLSMFLDFDAEEEDSSHTNDEEDSSSSSSGLPVPISVGVLNVDLSDTNTTLYVEDLWAHMLHANFGRMHIVSLTGGPSISAADVKAVISHGGGLTAIFGRIEALLIPEVVALSNPVRELVLHFEDNILRIDVDSSVQLKRLLSSKKKTASSDGDDNPVAPSVPFTIRVRLKDLTVTSYKDNSVVQSSEIDCEIVPVNSSSAPGVIDIVEAGGLHLKLQRMDWINIKDLFLLKDITFSAFVDNGNPNALHNFILNVVSCALNGHHSSIDFSRNLEDAEEESNRNVLLFPYAKIGAVMLTLAYQGVVLSAGETTVLIDPFEGGPGTDSGEIAKFYCRALVDRIPGLLTKTEVFGENVVDLAAVNAGRFAVGASNFATSGAGCLAGTLAIDGVRGAVALGKKSRGAKAEARYRVGDFARGVLHSFETASEAGAEKRGKKEGEKLSVGDFAVGTTEAAADYVVENKNRLGAAGGMGAGMVLGGAVGGPVGMLAGAIVGNIAGEKVLSATDALPLKGCQRKTNDSKAAGLDQSQASLSAQETLLKADEDTSLTSPDRVESEGVCSGDDRTGVSDNAGLETIREIEG